MRLAVAVLALGVAAAGATTSSATAGGARHTSAGHGYVPGNQIPDGAPIHGIVLSSSNRPLDSVIADIPRLAADGVNLVNIYVTKYLATATSHTIKSGTYTPSDQELEAAISLAHANGMAVQLSPTVWTVRPYVWRGAFQPDNLTAFFDNYRAMMDHYADLATANGVELLSIGSEYNTLDGYIGQWKRTAAEVRTHFSGLITYMAVTQHVALVKWWRAVDLIGVSPYYGLSGALQPTYTELRKSWQKRWLPFVHRISLRFNRPVLFDEIGYLSALGTTAAPWNPATTQPVSQQIQANAYAALLDAADSAPWLRGIVFFNWSPPVLAPLDRSYSPRDKLAECVMAQHWAAPDAPVGADGQPINCLGGTLAAVAAP